MFLHVLGGGCVFLVLCFLPTREGWQAQSSLATGCSLKRIAISGGLCPQGSAGSLQWNLLLELGFFPPFEAPSVCPCVHPIKGCICFWVLIKTNRSSTEQRKEGTYEQVSTAAQERCKKLQTTVGQIPGHGKRVHIRKKKSPKQSLKEGH